MTITTIIDRCLATLTKVEYDWLWLNMLTMYEYCPYLTMFEFVWPWLTMVNYGWHGWPCLTLLILVNHIFHNWPWLDYVSTPLIMSPILTMTKQALTMFTMVDYGWPWLTMFSIIDYGHMGLTMLASILSYSFT